MSKGTAAIRKMLCVVMDGIGIGQTNFGNAVRFALTPNMKYLAANGLYRTLRAHGTAVGLPSDADMGNSEVGHNALGAGKVYDQGAKLVQQAIESEQIWKSDVWKQLVNRGRDKALHFIGLLSDGNVHSHENHLFAMLRAAKRDGVRCCRIHVLLDGRDVGEKSAELYVQRLNEVIRELKSAEFELSVASGGGRMTTTMDRYEADWSMVERGWCAHVQGLADFQFSSIDTAISYFREHTDLTDQNLPAFVINAEGQSPQRIEDGDGVVFFNFRGDRAIEICRAFTDTNFTKFSRGRVPNVYFAGMMQYDGDLKLPENFLVGPPLITGTFGEYLVERGVRQFACSETQKFGHVTYFWNGNRSGKFSEKLEEYIEIPSDNISFDLKPCMKSFEIAEATIDRMARGAFDFGRINFANGDMVGHTGNFEASVIAVASVDLMLGRLIQAANKFGYILMVTADHGNADEMFDAKEKDFPNWQELPLSKRPKPKTSHTLNPVPCYVYDPKGSNIWQLVGGEEAGLGNIASSCLNLMGIGLPSDRFLSPFIEARK
jgi:2,3-bisphosphoglycerate-independent phosphoglycerate mutase